MRARAYSILFGMALLLASCHNVKKNNESTTDASSVVSVNYARGFTIRHFDNYTQIEVRNPWDTAKVLDTYILIDRDKPQPENLPQGKIVKIPVAKVAICTAVHAGIWKQLGEVAKIKAVCEPNFIDIPEIQTGIKTGTITDLGMATAIDLEKLIAVSPGALIVSPFENTSYGRLEKSGIPVVQDASYMENTPLGRAEWIKFEAAFMGKDSLAEKIFATIEQRYNKLVKLAASAKHRPGVFSELKYGQVWYVPGGLSYIGNFLTDAGAKYVWHDLEQTGSVPLSFESVYEKAEKADFWLIKYNNPTSDMSYLSLKNDYELYSNFEAFKKRQIFAINTAKSPYYEIGPMEPDVILADLISIFHPELMRNYTPKYYFPIK